ncbi:MAG TPA: glycosyltransferase [Phycisphaerales bacterium]|nr:glycosyltransferase [Phycisphaerales bacterium]HIO52249.1 glycosyltransferase [Phycisphaerales bacterium]
MSKPLTVIQMLPELESGGVELGTLEMGKYLVSQGHRSIVISAGGSMVAQLLKEGSEHVALPVGKKSLSTLRYISKVKKIMQDEKPDVLHLRSRVPAWIGYLAWKKIPTCNRPTLITTVHGRYSVSKYSGIMMRGDTVIAVSEMIKKYILENYPFVEPERIKVVCRGVDTSEYTFGYKPNADWKNAWFANYPQMRGKKLLTLPGRLTRLKGHADFIAIIDALVKAGENVHGIVVGGAHPKKKKYEIELQERVRALGLQSQITFVGQRADVKEILAISSIVYSLSQTPESFGRTTLEALSIGKPVIGYSHGGVEEQLKSMFPMGLIPSGSVQNAVSKTEVLLAKEQFPTENSMYTLENMCKGVLAVYEGD